MVDQKSEDVVGASRCPVCFKSPSMIIEPAVWPTLRKTEDFILRCQMGHPYIAMGDTYQQAVSHWNTYIAFRTQEANKSRVRVPSDTVLSHCKNCLSYTPSVIRFESGVSTEQCDRCHLIKSVKECE